MAGGTSQIKISRLWCVFFPILKYLFMAIVSLQEVPTGLLQALVLSLVVIKTRIYNNLLDIAFVSHLSNKYFTVFI